MDGAYDCSDKSDEQNLNEYFIRSSLCPLTSSQFVCDETTAHSSTFACDDGQFKSEPNLGGTFPCYNYRNMMFFCEFRTVESVHMLFSLWTLENGHCVDRGRIEKNLTDMDELEQCRLYLKCILIKRTTIGCSDVIRLFEPICKNKTIIYPSEPVLKPYVQTVYNLSKLDFRFFPNYVFFNGSIKCLGYKARSDTSQIKFPVLHFLDDYLSDYSFCNNSEKKLESGPQLDKNCWNDTKQSFLCFTSLQCISKHRLRNNIKDCRGEEDEIDTQIYYMKSKYRFDCPRKVSLSLSVSDMGDRVGRCNAGVDEYITSLKWILADRKCAAPNSIECNVLKAYIQSRLSILSTKTNEVLLFREYCDTVWHLPRGVDESLCNEWKCPTDQYQCLSGHCSQVKYITSLTNYDWHCPDASDYIDFWGIGQRSEHNSRIISNSVLQQKRNKIMADFWLPIPFYDICNMSKEYGCVLHNVSDPVNFTINRPCINLTQIGDGIIDCYGGLDERNILTCGNKIDEQRGFDFHCSDQQCIPYHRHCEDRCSNDEDNILCTQLQTLWNTTCPYPKCSFHCDRVFPKPDILSLRYGSDYCDPTRRSK